MTLADSVHHPIFDHFQPWHGTVPAYTQANWLGVLTDTRYANWAAQPEGVLLEPPLPPADNEEYAEWIDVLDAVLHAGERFAMVELGAGFGRWLADTAFAYRQLHPEGQLSLLGVEADATHFRWMGEHLKRNGIDGPSVHLTEAAVAGRAGRVVFRVFDDAAAQYGQSILSRTTWRGRLRRHRDQDTTVVRAITFAQALQPIDGVVHLVDLDVQGAEADVLEAGADELERVRCVHIGTHSGELEQRLRTLFTGLGWRCRTDYPCLQTTAETWWGARDVTFVDGVQTWLNPALTE
jgi:FkbM family methyltransferase